MTIEFFDPMTLLDPPSEPEKPEMPVLVTARFEVQADQAALEISSCNTPALFIQVIHEGRDGIESELISGDKTAQPILVHDAESVLIIARHEGKIIAGAMLEVDLGLVESIGKLMSPAITSNIIVDQVNVGFSERRIARQARTWQIDNAPDPDETVLVPTVKVEVAR